MLEYRRAMADGYQEFLQLMQDHMADYLESLMVQMEMTWEEFVAIYHSLGEVCCIFRDEQPTGYYWIEVRGRELHLHGLILKEGFRGQGIGTEVLAFLAKKYQDQVDLMELGVHQSNAGAIALYKRVGFETVRVLDDLGFWVMQRNLSQDASGR